jgi:hypothetical protein
MLSCIHIHIPVYTSLVYIFCFCSELLETLVAWFFSGDSRFSFLDVNHPFFPYYQHKVGVYEKLEVPAVAPSVASVASVGSTSGRMEVDDSSQDMNVTGGVGEDSRDSSDKSSDGSRHENCKQRPKPGKPFTSLYCGNA